MKIMPQSLTQDLVVKKQTETDTGHDLPLTVR